jgi:hypothetical protein
VHREVGGDQLRDIDEVAGLGGLARARAGHAVTQPAGASTLACMSLLIALPVAIFPQLKW